MKHLQTVMISTLLTLFCGMSGYASAAIPGNMELETHFKKIVGGQHAGTALANTMWEEVVASYTGKDRHYHTMAHLQNFYAQLQKCRSLTKDHDILFMAMVYHDVIYNSVDHKDEERSADLAVERLKSIGYPTASIAKCRELILATKAHAASPDSDTNYFNDADMSILGLERPVYQQYVKDVRLEYGNTPQFDAGRKRVLQYFLGMDRIFKTDFFYKIYEAPARANVAWELSQL
jgi:predicted metal-dependent HD superfamily phosphohydrolase